MAAVNWVLSKSKFYFIAHALCPKRLSRILCPTWIVWKDAISKCAEPWFSLVAPDLFVSEDWGSLSSLQLGIWRLGIVKQSWVGEFACAFHQTRTQSLFGGCWVWIRLRASPLPKIFYLAGNDSGSTWSSVGRCMIGWFQPPLSRAVYDRLRGVQWHVSDQMGGFSSALQFTLFSLISHPQVCQQMI